LYSGGQVSVLAFCYSRAFLNGGGMEYLIIWLLFAGLAAYFSSVKGRSSVGWFFIGALLGPLALVALWIVPSLRFDDTQSRNIASRFGVYAKYRKCPYCAEVVLKEAVKCKHCQSELEPAE